MFTVFNSKSEPAQKSKECLQHTFIPTDKTPIHRFFYEDDCNLNAKEYLNGFLTYFPYTKEGARKENLACSPECSLISGELYRAEAPVIANQRRKIQIQTADLEKINKLFNDYTNCCKKIKGVLDLTTLPPKVTKPEVTKPEVTKPEVTKPEVTKPGVLDLTTLPPEVTKPRSPRKFDSRNIGHDYKNECSFILKIDEQSNEDLKKFFHRQCINQWKVDPNRKEKAYDEYYNRDKEIVKSDPWFNITDEEKKAIEQKDDAELWFNDQ